MPSLRFICTPKCLMLSATLFEAALQPRLVKKAEWRTTGLSQTRHLAERHKVTKFLVEPHP